MDEHAGFSSNNEEHLSDPLTGEAIPRWISQVLDFLPDPTFVVDAQGRIILWNKAIERLSGLAAVDMLGQGVCAYSLPLPTEQQRLLADYVLHPDIPLPDEPHFRRYDDGSIGYEGGYRFKLADLTRSVTAHAGPIRDSFGAVIGVIETIRDVTEHRNMGLALRESEERFRTLFENATEAIARISPAGRYLSVNPSFARLVGFASPQEVVAASTDKEWDFNIHREDRRTIRQLLEKHDKVEGYELEFIRRDESRGWASLNIHAVRDMGGRLLYYDGIGVDITERKRAELALRESEEKFRLLFESSADGNLLMEDGRYIACNAAALRIAGLKKKDQLIGTRPLDASPERQPNGASSAEKSQHMIALALEKGFHRFEWVRRRSDGGDVHIDVMLTAVPVHGKKLLYTVWRDITDRKHAELALRESEERYRSLFENATEGIFRSTPAGRFLAVNPALARMAGFATPGEMIENIKDIGLEIYAHSEDRQVVGRMLAEHDRFEGYEVEFIRRDGKRVWVSMNIHAVRDTRGAIRYYDGTCVDVTERKRMEQDLRESEGKFRSLFESSADGHLIIENGRIIDCNEAALMIAGYQDKSQLVGMRPQDFSPEIQSNGNSSRAKTWCMTDATLRQGSQRFEWVHRRIDGALIDVEVMLTAVTMQGKQLLFATWRDISGRKQAEAELRASEERYRSLFENATEGIFRTTPAGRFMHVNPSFARMIGFASPREVVDTIKDIAAELYVIPAERRTLLRLLEDHDKVEGFEIEFLRRDKSGFWMSINIHTVRDEAGRILYLDGTCVDITERKRAANRLRKSEERYRLVAENIHDIIAVYDLDFRYTYVSPSVERITGHRPQDMIGMSALDFMTEESKTKMEAILAQIHGLVRAQDSCLQSRSWTVELQRRVKSGQTIWTESHISLLLNEHGSPLGILSVTRDISERKRDQEKMDLYQEHLQRTQKLEAIGTLAGGIAHDFNNILSVIIGYSELIRDELSPESPSRQKILEVLKGGERAKDLVKQILTFSRQVESRATPLNIHLIVKEVLKLLRATIPATIAIEQDIDPQAGTVLADPVQIHQVVMNLCTNAYHAMREESGVLTVSLRAVNLEDGSLLSHPELHPGDYVKLTVRDTGCGMDEATRRRVFEPFFTTKEPGRGTGLGLSISHGIVKRLGGAITLASTPGAGSTFEVFLPRFGIDAAPDTDEAEIIPLGDGERILLIDDEPDIIAFGRIMLEQIGYAVQGYPVSSEALEIFRADPQAFDLVITDQTMPGLRGDQLAEAMLAIRQELPIILMTGYSAIIDRESALRLGIRELVPKPFSRSDMAHAIRRALKNPGGPFLQQKSGETFLPR